MNLLDEIITHIIRPSRDQYKLASLGNFSLYQGE